MEILTQKALTDKIKTTYDAEDTDEDRTETFQTPNARVATDTQAENNFIESAKLDLTCGHIGIILLIEMEKNKMSLRPY